MLSVRGSWVHLFPYRGAVVIWWWEVRISLHDSLVWRSRMTISFDDLVWQSRLTILCDVLCRCFVFVVCLILLFSWWKLVVATFYVFHVIIFRKADIRYVYSPISIFLWSQYLSICVLSGVLYMFLLYTWELISHAVSNVSRASQQFIIRFL